MFRDTHIHTRTKCIFSADFISVVIKARGIIGRDAVGRNAGAFVYGTNANAFLSFYLFALLSFCISTSVRPMRKLRVIPVEWNRHFA